MPFNPIQTRVRYHIQEKFGEENRKRDQEGHIGKLNKFTSEHFFSPIVISAKKDGSVEWQWMLSPRLTKYTKNQYQMSNFWSFWTRLPRSLRQIRMEMFGSRRWI